VRRPREDGFDVLAFRHPLAGCQLVKGSVEHHESIEAAAERELHEEAGIVGRAVASLGELWHETAGQSWHFVLMDVSSELSETWAHQAPDDGGHTFECFWHPLDARDTLDWHALYTPALAHLRAVIAVETLPVRRCARLLILDAAHQVLLFRYADGRRPPFWATVGGQLLPGESIEETAARELLEETGYRDPIGPCVRRRDTVYQAGDVPLSRWIEDYFVVYTAGGPLQTAAWTEEERRNIREWRWWSVAELRAQSEQLLPIWLPDEVERCSSATQQ
jgi:8-oxo-dGTP pyrophosphatase MutT (NUDIX family)